MTFRMSFLLPMVMWCWVATGQANMQFTHPDMLSILKGNYDPQAYAATVVLDDAGLIAATLAEEISPDSMKAYLFELDRFENRNTASDTVSDTRGIGAAQRWARRRFDDIAARHDDRLLTGYFQFDQDVCGMLRHRNVVALLPGRRGLGSGTVIIEAHLDSRCADNCDIDCLAQGMEDNGSGVALVLEMARVLSRFTFDHSILFVLTTGEEQGLVGANALAVYAVAEDIPVRAVLNNDVIGGVICGETSSPPSCPGFNHIDSTQVRLFSFGGFNSPNKALARYIKMQYQNRIEPIAAVPMRVTIMSAEDRTGRGGDHIPFRQKGFPAMRFTSANEHGNADVSDPDYHDRQHTSGDLLGVDTDGDEVIDSFFVDFNYLARNASINGIGLAMAAKDVRTPTLASVGQDGDFVYVEIDDPEDYNRYLVGLRVHTNDFDTLYEVTGAKTAALELPSRELNLFVSVAAVDTHGIESLFSPEERVILTSASGEAAGKPVELFQNRPNPFDESTVISFWLDERAARGEAQIVITDTGGRLIRRMPVAVQAGMNEILYEHGYNMTGTFLYSLWLDGVLVDTKKMVFSN